VIVIAVLILVALAAILSLLGWRKGSRLFALLALLVVVVVGCGPLPSFMLTRLQEGYSSVPVVHQARRSAIVLLGGGTEEIPGAPGPEVSMLAYGRLVKAFEVYKTCKLQAVDCVVIITGGDASRHGASEAAVYAARLTELGVGREDIVLEQRSLNTWQNAQFTAALLKTRAVDQVFLISSGIHLHRAVLYFEHFGVQAQPVRADYLGATMTLIPQAYNFLLTDLALHEYAGVLRYFVYEKLGWNVSAADAGAV
jgi:uncharacterized SAM-binding protein YcdF (DUF218 family)